MVQEIVRGERLFDVGEIEIIKFRKHFRVIKCVGTICIDTQFDVNAGSISRGLYEIDISTGGDLDLDAPVSLGNTCRNLGGEVFGCGQ